MVDRSFSRTCLRDLVVDLVQTRFRWLDLYGSWPRGDFHLDRTGTFTYSDLDLQGAPGTRRAWADAKRGIGGALAEVCLPMRVSIRPLGVHDQLTVGTSRWIVLGTLLASLRGPSGDTPEKRGYLTAKFLLALLQERVGEPPASVAARLGSVAAEHAYAIKTGATRQFRLSNRSLGSLLDLVDADQSHVLAEILDSAVSRHSFARICEMIRTDEISNATYRYILHGMRYGK